MVSLPEIDVGKEQCAKKMSLNTMSNQSTGLFFGGKMGLFVLVVVAGLLLAGCQTGGKKTVQSIPAGDGGAAALNRQGLDGAETLAPEGRNNKVFMANIDNGRFDPLFVKSRITFYGNRAAQWQILGEKMSDLGLSREQEQQWQQCTGLLTGLVSGYTAVLDGEGDPLDVSRKDISFTESDCDQMFAAYTALIPELLAKFQQEAGEQAEATVDYYAERKEYDKVVAAYENAVEFRGKAFADLRLQEIYGRALLHIGRLDKAALVFSQVLVESGPYEKWPLRLEVAELLIASGQYEKARAEYLYLAEILNSWEEINKSVTDKLALLFGADEHARELALYSQALHSFLTFDGESIPHSFDSAVRELQNKYPGGIHTSAAEALYTQAEERVRQNVAMQLAKVDELSNDNEFKKALDILAKMKQSLLPADSVTSVVEAISSVSGAREHYIQLAKEKRVEDLADRWQEGLNLLDMELYDDAITVFMELLGTEYDSKAAAEIEKASLQAAKFLRKKAATLFIKARQTTDPAARTALLKESRNLLQTILTRYPQVEIADKVTVNLQVIEEQLLAVEGM